MRTRKTGITDHVRSALRWITRARTRHTTARRVRSARKKAQGAPRYAVARPQLVVPGVHMVGACRARTRPAPHRKGRDRNEVAARRFIFRLDDAGKALPEAMFALCGILALALLFGLCAWYDIANCSGNLAGLNAQCAMLALVPTVTGVRVGWRVTAFSGGGVASGTLCNMCMADPRNFLEASPVVTTRPEHVIRCLNDGLVSGCRDGESIESVLDSEDCIIDDMRRAVAGVRSMLTKGGA